jgi:beta-lactamase regulating signal transducer with metallopeptidase domain
MMDGPLRDTLLIAADLVISVVLLKGTVLMGLAVLLVIGLRRASAAVHAGVWSTAVLTLVALPLLGKFVPWWELGVIAFPQALFASDTALQRSVADALGGSGPWHASPPAIWLAVIWLAGALILGAHFVWQRLGVELIARAGQRLYDARTEASVARLRQTLGVRRPTRIVHSEIVTAPYAFGVWRATVVLPYAALEWSDGQLDAVLRHELAHVTRADYALLLLGELARVFYWPNPATWVALRALRRTQDAACDDLVLRGGVPATSYARHLVDVARTSLTAPRLPRAALPLLRGCDLRSRVGAVLDRSSDRRPVTRLALASGAALAAAVAVTIAGANFWVCPSAGATTGDARAGTVAATVEQTASTEDPLAESPATTLPPVASTTSASPEGLPPSSPTG